MKQSRVERAVEMHVRCASYDEIAAECGYRSARAVANAISQYYAAHPIDIEAERRAMVARLTQVEEIAAQMVADGKPGAARRLAKVRSLLARIS
jgi:hypothetical protein